MNKFIQIRLAVVFSMVAALASAQDVASARAAYQREQALQEVPRLSQQFDQLSANYESLAGRVARMEGGASGTDELRAEIASLRSQIDQLRRDQERMRTEIVAELGRKIAAMPRPAAPAPVPTVSRGRQASKSKPAPEPEYTGSYYEHTVTSGQTLSLIAKGFDVPLSKILQANPGIKPNALRVGQKLRIPADK